MTYSRRSTNKGASGDEAIRRFVRSSVQSHSLGSPAHAGSTPASAAPADYNLAASRCIKPVNHHRPSSRVPSRRCSGPGRRPSAGSRSTSRPRPCRGIVAPETRRGWRLMGYVKTHVDKVAAWVAIVAGVIALAVGWNGVWHTLITGEQMPYIVSGGIAGIFLLGLGALWWVSSEFRQERSSLDAVAHHLETTGSLPPGWATTTSRSDWRSGRSRFPATSGPCSVCSQPSSRRSPTTTPISRPSTGKTSSADTRGVQRRRPSVERR